MSAVAADEIVRNAATLLAAGRVPSSLGQYHSAWEAFFDAYARETDDWHRRHDYYHRSIQSLARFYIPKGARVLEVGSGNGDLLAALEPSYGLGIDLSGEMVKLAAGKYPNLEFRRMAAESLDLPDQQFDYIVLSDAVGYFYDICEVFERLRTVCHPGTRVVMHWYSRLWQPLLRLTEKMGLKYPQPLLNWTTVTDVNNLLQLGGFELVHRREHLLLPKNVPLLSAFANRYLAHLPGFRWLCLTNWVVARPRPVPPRTPPPRVSVIVPCRNEAGNIQQVIDRVPSMGAHTEIILVEGHSTDDTLAVCRNVTSAATRDVRLFVQEGKGKADAVRLGFDKATGDVLMILDADITVPPEDLPRFYDALVSGKAEMVNGSRLVYAMDPQAMRLLNLAGNKFFAALLSWLLGQPVKDTLCGTKVLWRRDYDRLVEGRPYFGDFDPFGDFDLLFGAAKLNLKIVEVPIRYRERVYGTTNISRFTHGWLLIQMSARAAAKLRFIR